MPLLASRPDADQVETATLLFNLRRSFAPEDRNLQAQFWYVRQGCGKATLHLALSPASQR